MSLPRSLLLLLTLSVVSFRVPSISALKGDSWCGDLMCVDATVHDSTVTCELLYFSSPRPFIDTQVYR